MQHRCYLKGKTSERRPPVAGISDVAKAKGRRRGNNQSSRKPKRRTLISLHQGGVHTTTEIAELFGIARSTVYRAIQRATTAPPR
ncbi:helix-turn-helix domain-containing protein [Arthrobacter sp. U41]|uniref:helix-turn-helix domain-containing protein n=1 Tax=Arthrobacter sp. U41 TaxID=1849032 RepID=UPI001E59D0D5|nr:helix-turn-helix domain-containing protein [Arthrobacter sp. U41]